MSAPYIDHLQEFVAACQKNNYQGPVSDLGNLPVTLYTDPKRLQREKEKLFRQSPVIIGHVSQVPKPGDHFTFDHSGEPLLVVRDKSGEVNVFYNICRHRGVRLVNSDNVSRKPSFVCPYHNWAYNLDGSILNIPCVETFKAEDKVSERGLKAVTSAVAGGFIFVMLDSESSLDPAAFLGELQDDFEALKIPGQVFFKQTVRTTKSNWKLIVEAFQDGYHVVRLHRNSVGPLFLDNVADSRRVNDHLRAIVARNDFTDMYDAPVSDWDIRNQVSLAFYIYPNTIIIIHPDYISHLGLFPTAVDETICVHSCFLDETPQSEQAYAHFERAFDMIDKNVFTAEDFFVCEQAQIGMNSGVNENFPLSDHEIGLKLFHEILNEKLA